MHELCEISYVVHRRVRKNAVPKIEDVPRSRVGEAKDVLGSLLKLVPRSEQQNGIEIALYGVIVPNRSPAFVERDAPVEADDFGASLRH